MPPKRRTRTNVSYPQRRKRGFPLIRLTGGLVICILAGKMLLAKKTEVPASIQQAAVVPAIEIPTLQAQELFRPVLDQGLCPIVHIVKPGDSFFSIFAKHNIARDEAARIMQGLRQLDQTRLFPGDSMVIRRKTDSCFSSIDFFSSLRNKFTVENSDSCVKVSREALPVVTHTYVLNGRLETSLSESMFGLGVSDVITANIADIFAWDINFFIDPRKGDSYQVIFEKKIVNGRTCGYGDIIAARYTLGDNRTSYAFGMRDSSGRLRYYDNHGNAVQKQFLKAPLRYSRVSSGFSFRRKHPVLGIVRPHLGVDYAASSGTPVNAAADGKIIFAGTKGDYGKMVIIAHGGAYQTYYGHLQSFSSNIRIGKQVVQGDIIGRVGATGLATGPHLDYRMLRGGKFVNPMTISSPSLRNVPEHQKQEFSALLKQCTSLFERRFSGRQGCYLLDITTPVQTEPQFCRISKTAPDAQRVTRKQREAHGGSQYN